MAASIALIGSEPSVIRFPRITVTGLWDALAASTSHGSAAGSRPAEPPVLGRPISVDRGTLSAGGNVIDMFAFRSSDSEPEPHPAA